MRLALAILMVPLPGFAQASLTGALVNAAGTYVAKADVELDSGTKKYLARTDDVGVYRFSDLPLGEYTLTFHMPGYTDQRVKSIRLLEREQKRLPDVPLDNGGCGLPSRELVLLVAEDYFGRLTGRVVPRMKNVEVILICRTFTACRSTKTDSDGAFNFDQISAGSYGLNFRRDGFYPENATGYSTTVNAGWESVYSFPRLQRCPNGNCDPKLRPKPGFCE